MLAKVSFVIERKVSPILRLVTFSGCYIDKGKQYNCNYTLIDVHTNSDTTYRGTTLWVYIHNFHVQNSPQRGRATLKGRVIHLFNILTQY